MKAIITTVALTSALIAGTASAASVQQSHYGAGTTIDSASHYSSVQQVTIDGANLESNAGAAGLYIGSK